LGKRKSVERYEDRITASGPCRSPAVIYPSKQIGNSLAGKIDEAEQATRGGDIQAFSELSRDVLDVSKNITTLFSWLISDIFTA